MPAVRRRRARCLGVEQADDAQGDTSDSKAAPKLGKGAGETINDASQSVLPRLLDLGSVASSQSK